MVRLARRGTVERPTGGWSCPRRPAAPAAVRATSPPRDRSRSASSSSSSAWVVPVTALAADEPSRSGATTDHPLRGGPRARRRRHRVRAGRAGGHRLHAPGRRSNARRRRRPRALPAGRLTGRAMRAAAVEPPAAPAPGRPSDPVNVPDRRHPARPTDRGPFGAGRLRRVAGHAVRRATPPATDAPPIDQPSVDPSAVVDADPAGWTAPADDARPDLAAEVDAGRPAQGGLRVPAVLGAVRQLDRARLRASSRRSPSSASARPPTAASRRRPTASRPCRLERLDELAADDRHQRRAPQPRPGSC